MLVFIDESGHPHPNDSTIRPVVVAACFSEADARRISSRVHAIKRDLLTRERSVTMASIAPALSDCQPASNKPAKTKSQR